VPYSKRAHTFRTAVGDFPAARARSGSPSFVGLNVNSPVPAGFVAELRTQHSPARIQDGLRHLGFREFGGADIADDNQGVFADKPRRRLVKLVFARVGDLGVDRTDAALVSGPLRNAKRGLVLAIVSKRRDGLAIAQRGERLEPEIDANAPVAGRQIVRDLALEDDEPSSARILGKAAGLDALGKVSRFPEPEPALEVSHLRAIDLHRARDKRHPAEGALGAEAGAEARTLALGVTRRGELAADGLNGIGVQAEQRAASGAELDQVEGAGPLSDATSFPAGFGLALGGDAEVPNLIGRIGVPGKVFASGCVLDTVFETEHHAQTHNWSTGKMQDYRTGRHCVFALHVHLVFVTKFRRDVLSELAISDLTAIFARICKDFEATLVECSGEDDHVHLLVEYPPKLTLSRLVNSLKGVSSRLLREDRPEITGRYFKGVLWSPSYFAASCGGAPISIIRQYIEQQRSALPPRPERRGFRALRA
jgi:putative transposase